MFASNSRYIPTLVTWFLYKDKFSYLFFATNEDRINHVTKPQQSRFNHSKWLLRIAWQLETMAHLVILRWNLFRCSGQILFVYLLKRESTCLGCLRNRTIQQFIYACYFLCLLLVVINWTWNINTGLSEYEAGSAVKKKGYWQGNTLETRKDWKNSTANWLFWKIDHGCILKL